MSLFNVSGTSKLPNGETKVRFANDMTRVKVLVKGGHTDIDLLELPRAMTKEEVVAYLLSINFADGNAVKEAAIQAEAVKRRVGEYARPAAKEKAAPKASNVKVVAKTRAAKPAKKSVKEQLGLTDEEMSKMPKSVLADMEDAPF
jgi:hypothetical protein